MSPPALLPPAPDPGVLSPLAPMLRPRPLLPALLVATLLALLPGRGVVPAGPSPLAGQTAVPTPAAGLGFDPSAGGRVADWADLLRYYQELARTSARVRLDTLGPSTGGRALVMAVITSPENQARLEDLRSDRALLADPRRVSGEAELDRLLDRGRVVVLLTHGVHPSEVASSLAAPGIAHTLATSRDPGVLSILENAVILQIPSLNPDGTDAVAAWVERTRGTRWAGLPRPGLDHPYAGHDTNRDWASFLLPETRAVVAGAYRRWHPHIVFDVHQMEADGPRMFLPPYRDPVDPHVDPALVAALGHLGSAVAADLTLSGRAGVATGVLYDAWSPSRAYVHYHGGVRILSETASSRGVEATEIPRALLRADEELDAAGSSVRQPLPWEGGRWEVADALDYIHGAALSLLDHAATRRRFWLTTSWTALSRAVDPGASGPRAWVVPATPENLTRATGLQTLLRTLVLGGVDVLRAEAPFEADGIPFPGGSWIVPRAQPAGPFAATLLDVQDYPDLRTAPDGPLRRPQDATAHSLHLLAGVEVVPLDRTPTVALSPPIPVPRVPYRLPDGLQGPDAPRVGIYLPPDESEATGWTRWLFDRFGLPYQTPGPDRIRRGALGDSLDVLLLQTRSRRELVEGLSPDRAPPELAGGLGEAGLRALRTFVRGGGRLVTVGAAGDLAVELLDLGVVEVLSRVPAPRFDAPGALVGLEVEAGGEDRAAPEPMAAWMGRDGRAYRVTDPTARVLARYDPARPVLSGRVVGAHRLGGHAAVVELAAGRGRVVLMGIQPNHRGHSPGTWPLLFRALRPDGTAPEPGG